jgi:hypothetical protein
MYTTYRILSWHWYQRVTSSSDQTIEKYNKSCEEDAKREVPHVMVLRENVVELGGYYFYGNGFPIEHTAKVDGYVDVRTGKKYPSDGAHSFCKDLYLTSESDRETN